MEDIGTGAGLAALGFWLFIAIIVATGVWDGIRKREAKHETLRRIIESGQTIDSELTDKVLGLTGDNKDLERDLKVSGLIVIFAGIGLAIMGWSMSLLLEPELLFITFGVSPMVGFVGIGLLVAAHYVGRWSRGDGGSEHDHSAA